jgi:hypothetical protein
MTRMTQKRQKEIFEDSREWRTEREDRFIKVQTLDFGRKTFCRMLVCQRVQTWTPDDGICMVSKWCEEGLYDLHDAQLWKISKTEALETMKKEVKEGFLDGIV